MATARPRRVHTDFSTKRIHSPHGEHIVHPYHHTFASSSGMHSQEQSMFNFMRHLHERSDSDWQCRDTAYDNDTAYTCEPAVTVPADILRQYTHMQSAVTLAYHSPADPISPKEPFSAWRWKMLMIQMNLLSALNRICHELLGRQYEPHRITSCDMTGSEQKLEWQNFELKSQYHGDTVSCRRNPPCHVFQLRRFKPLQTTGAGVPPLTHHVNLFDCTYGIVQSVDRKWQKPVWSTTSQGAERYLLHTSAASRLVMETITISCSI